MVDTVSNSEGITVTLPNGALTANPSGETRTFRLTNIPDAIGALQLQLGSCSVLYDHSALLQRFSGMPSLVQMQLKYKLPPLCAILPTGNYDFKVRVGVKNSLVASQNLGGVTGVTVCGSATTQLDSSVYWSELSSAVTAIGAWGQWLVLVLGI